MQYLTNTEGPKRARKFPDGFKFGVATASYQVEGAWDRDEKSPSIWDTFCHSVPSPIVDRTTGDEACCSYQYYKRDLEMVKFLNVDYYRISISWPRILPLGFANYVSEKGVKYYSNVIDGLIEAGIDPVVTLYHWDLPQNLQDLGGWANPLVAEWFEDYARVLYRIFGDRVKTWITINEPKQICIFGYGQSRFAPGLKMYGTGDYMAVKNALIAHARAWHLYDKEFRPTQRGVCGIGIAVDFRYGASDDLDDVEAGLDAMEFEVGLYSHPIFSPEGDFPERAIRRIAMRSEEQGFPRSRLPKMTPEEVKLVKGTSDFFGFNHYSTRFYTRKTWVQGKVPVPSYEDDLGADSSYLEEKFHFKRGAIPHSTEIPGGIRAALNWVKNNCNNPPIMIFENGFGTLGGLNDAEDRISYYKKYLDNVLDAIEIDKCIVKCYTAWSLMDNFEWNSGLSVKFGLFQVDFEDEQKTRQARNSALWFKQMVTSKILDPNFVPEFENKIF